MGDKYLNSTGLSHFWAKIKAFFVKGNGKVFVGTCASDAAEVDKVVTCSDFAASDLVAGTTIYVTFGETNSGAVGSLTMNVNGTGAKHIKYINNNAIGDIPGVGYLVAGLTYQFIYDGTYWVVQMNYNTNTNDTTSGYGRHTYANWSPTTALGRYVLSFTKNETQIVPATAVNNSVATTKALTTESFNPFEPIFYYSTTAQIAAGTNISASYLWFGYERIDLRYSFNTGTTLTAHKDVFIKCVLQSDGSAKLASGNPIVQSLPTTDDGFIYIHLGRAYDTYRISFTFTHNVYEFKNGGIQLLTRDAATVNGHTVAANVPSGAKFTDTVTTVTNSGSGNAVTAITASNGALTVTKGSTFLTSHQDISGKVDKVSGKGLSTNDFTDALETKLNGIATGAEVNQNAFSNVKVGSTTIAADTKTDTLTLAASSNVTLTPDATNSKITIAANDPGYTNLSLGQGYGTCSTAATTTAKVGTLSGYTLTKGGIVSIKFTYKVLAGATLNINSRGAKAIRHRGAAIQDDVIFAGDTATFIYDGSYYHLLSVDRRATYDSSEEDFIRFPNGMIFTWGASQVNFTSANYVDVSCALPVLLSNYKVFFSITSTNSTQALAPVVELREKTGSTFTARVWKNLSSTATLSCWLGWFAISD